MSDPRRFFRATDKEKQAEKKEEILITAEAELIPQLLIKAYQQQHMELIDFYLENIFKNKLFFNDNFKDKLIEHLIHLPDEDTNAIFQSLKQATELATIPDYEKLIIDNILSNIQSRLIPQIKAQSRIESISRELDLSRLNKESISPFWQTCKRYFKKDTASTLIRYLDSQTGPEKEAFKIRILETIIFNSNIKLEADERTVIADELFNTLVHNEAPGAHIALYWNLLNERYSNDAGETVPHFVAFVESTYNDNKTKADILVRAFLENPEISRSVKHLFKDICGELETDRGVKSPLKKYANMPINEGIDPPRRRF